jgi:hypothetical protein
MQTVELRAAGTSPEDPLSGMMVGTAEVPDGDAPTVLVTPLDASLMARIFVLLEVYGPPQYVETVPYTIKTPEVRS